MSGGVRKLTRLAWPILGVATASLLAFVAVIPPLQRAAADNWPPSPDFKVHTAVAGAVEQRSSDFVVSPTSRLAVVQVSVTSCGDRSSGSGFVAADGLVLTAAHVVGDAALVRIDFGAMSATGEVMGRFADGRDIAVIEIGTGDLATPAAGLVPPLGQPITIVGHRAGGPRTVGVGARVEPLWSTFDAVRGNPIGVASPSGMGFSGGPAVDAQGGLIGIVVATEVGTGTTLIVPIERPSDLSRVELVENECDADS